MNTLANNQNTNPESADSAPVWLAAHWPGKLKKDAVLKFVIHQYINRILDPAFPAPLRVRSHLLAGIVHIYERKVRYLYEDAHKIRAQSILSMRKAVQQATQASSDATVNPDASGTQAPTGPTVAGTSTTIDSVSSTKQSSIDKNLLDQSLLQNAQLTLGPEFDASQMLNRISNILQQQGLDTSSLQNTAVPYGVDHTSSEAGVIASFLSNVIDRRLDTMGAGHGMHEADGYMNDLSIARSMMAGNFDNFDNLSNLDDLLSQDNAQSTLRDVFSISGLQGGFEGADASLNIDSIGDLMNNIDYSNFTHFANFAHQANHIPQHGTFDESSGEFSLSVQLGRGAGTEAQQFTSDGSPIISHGLWPGQQSTYSPGSISGDEISLSIEQARALQSSFGPGMRPYPGPGGPMHMAQGIGYGMKDFLDMSNVPTMNADGQIHTGPALFGAPMGYLHGVDDFDFSGLTVGTHGVEGFDQFDDEALLALQRDHRNAPSAVPSGEHSPSTDSLLTRPSTAQTAATASRQLNFQDFAQPLGHGADGLDVNLLALLDPSALAAEAAAASAAASAVASAAASTLSRVRGRNRITASQIRDGDVFTLPADAETELSLELTALRQTEAGHADTFPVAKRRRTVLSSIPASTAKEFSNFSIESALGSGSSSSGADALALAVRGFSISATSASSSMTGELPYPLLPTGKLDILTMLRKPRLARTVLGQSSAGLGDSIFSQNDAMPSSYLSYAGEVGDVRGSMNFVSYIGDQPADYAATSGPHPMLKHISLPQYTDRLRDKLSATSSRQSGLQTPSLGSIDELGLDFQELLPRPQDQDLEMAQPPEDMGIGLSVLGGSVQQAEKFSLEAFSPADLAQFDIEEFEPFLSEVAAVQQAALEATAESIHTQSRASIEGLGLDEESAYLHGYLASSEDEFGAGATPKDISPLHALANELEQASGSEFPSLNVTNVGGLQDISTATGAAHVDTLSGLNLPKWTQYLAQHPNFSSFQAAIGPFIEELEKASKLVYETEVDARVARIAATGSVDAAWLREYRALLLARYSVNQTQCRTAALAFNNLLHLVNTEQLVAKQQAPYDDIMVSLKNPVVTSKSQ